MGKVTTDDGVQLYVEETGSGVPLVFVHEFGGDYRSLEPQVRCFARRYRCITYNARGFPPSDVDERPQSYSQERALRDLVNVMDALAIERANIVGISMGSFTVMHLALHHPERVSSMVIAACGYGAEPDTNAAFREQVVAGADLIRDKGMAQFAEAYSKAPTRVQLENKDPRAFADFKAQLTARAVRGAELTMRGVQFERQPFDAEFTRALAGIAIPTLVVTGDEDEPTLQPSLFLKRTIQTADLAVLPGTGHTLNLEEPEAFNRLLDDFLHQVLAGRWRARDPRAMQTSMLGVDRAP
jgi:pimeloyl-ACP methyl ester carboxylesterase